RGSSVSGVRGSFMRVARPPAFADAEHSANASEVDLEQAPLINLALGNQAVATHVRVGLGTVFVPVLENLSHQPCVGPEVCIWLDAEARNLDVAAVVVGHVHPRCFPALQV